jgi:hypothetical protein
MFCFATVVQKELRLSFLGLSVYLIVNMLIVIRFYVALGFLERANIGIQLCYFCGLRSSN